MSFSNASWNSEYSPQHVCLLPPLVPAAVAAVAVAPDAVFVPVLFAAAVTAAVSPVLGAPGGVEGLQK